MKKNDVRLAAIVLVTAGLLFFLQKMLFSTPEKNTVVAVYHEKTRIGTYPLYEETEQILYFEDGAENILVIQDGSAWIKDANCPDKLCVKQGKISGSGQSLICLPHKLTVTVEGGKKEELDAVAG